MKNFSMRARLSCGFSPELTLVDITSGEMGISSIGCVGISFAASRVVLNMYLLLRVFLKKPPVSWFLTEFGTKEVVIPCSSNSFKSDRSL